MIQPDLEIIQEDNQNFNVQFKKENFPKIELYRKAIGKEILFYNDSNIVAIATDENIKIENNIHKLNLNDPQQIVDYIINFLSLNK